MEKITWVRCAHKATLFLLIFNADHNCMFLPFVATEDADTLDQLFRGTPEEVACEYITSKGFGVDTESNNYSL